MINCCCLSKLKELIPTPLLDTLTTIADKRANKTTEQHHAIVQSKLIRLQRATHKKCHKYNKNWVRKISSHPLDVNETQVLSNGLKHAVTPKHIPNKGIVSNVEYILACQRELPESTKDDIRSRIASTLQSASLTGRNLMKDKLHALRRLRLTSHDTNYNPRTTSLTLSKRYKYQTTTSLCSSTSNHFSPAYHFNLPLTVLRPPSTNHTTNHHFPQTTLWTSCTFV